MRSDWPESERLSGSPRDGYFAPHPGRSSGGILFPKPDRQLSISKQQASDRFIGAAGQLDRSLAKILEPTVDDFGLKRARSGRRKHPPRRFKLNFLRWRRQIIKSLFGKPAPSPAPTLVKNMSDLRPYLSQYGFTIEDRDPVEILGTRMERVRMRKPGSVSAVGFGGGFFHIVHMVGLARTLAPKEIVDFNASVQIFNLTHNEEPPSAIIKAHVPARFGALPQTITSLLSLSEDAVEKLVAVVGPANVRTI